MGTLAFLYTYGSTAMWRTDYDDSCNLRFCSLGRPWTQSSGQEEFSLLGSASLRLALVSQMLRNDYSRTRHTPSLIHVQWEDSGSLLLGILRKILTLSHQLWLSHKPILESITLVRRGGSLTELNPGCFTPRDQGWEPPKLRLGILRWLRSRKWKWFHSIHSSALIEHLPYTRCYFGCQRYHSEQSTFVAKCPIFQSHLITLWI